MFVIFKPPSERMAISKSMTEEALRRMPLLSPVLCRNVIVLVSSLLDAAESGSKTSGSSHTSILTCSFFKIEDGCGETASP